MERIAALTAAHFGMAAVICVADEGAERVVACAGPAAAARLARATGRAGFLAEAPMRGSDDEPLGRLVLMQAEPRPDFSREAQEELAAFAGLAADRLELSLAASENAATAGFAKAAEYAFMAIDTSGRVTFVNPACEAMLGYPPGEMLGRDMAFMIPQPLQGAHRAGLARIAAGGVSTLAGRTVELTALHRDGHTFPIEFSMSVWRDRGDIGIGAIMRDISEWRARDALLVQMAHHDGLTALANRALFDERLTAALGAGTGVAVVLLDLDGFKAVNDSLGHATGNALLQAVAIRLPACMPAHATVARLGGDEFGLMVPGMGDSLAIGACASAILDAFRTPFDLCGHTFHVGLSLGAAIAGSEGGVAEDLVADADLALYQAKRDGRRCFRLFEPAMRAGVIARRQLHDELSRALDASELVLHYQPQVRLQDGRIVGVEALLRWHHPRRGLLMPGAFLAALEAHPLAPSVGRWIIEEACRQAEAWRASGVPPIRVAVNLFGSHLETGGLAAEVMAALDHHRLPPETLEIEVTERIALQVDEAVLDPIRALHRHGVAVAFDDFGTGYASLSSLKRLPLTRLKIDRSFVRDVLTDRHDADIIRAVLGMAQSFGLDVIAEGIETREQEAALRAMGCREGQGYLYGKAMPADALRDLVRHGPASAGANAA